MGWEGESMDLSLGSNRRRHWDMQGTLVDVIGSGHAAYKSAVLLRRCQE